MMFPRSIPFRTVHPRSSLAGLTAALFILLVFVSTGRAALVTYVATDVADTSPGQDLWEYAYTVGLADFTTGEGFTVSFDRHLYTLLQSPAPFVNADWNPLTIQPDLALNSNGFYDALTLRDHPSLANLFKVQFVWLGSGTPGSQSFVTYNRQFQVTSAGVTVPEPSTFVIGFFVPAAVFLSRLRRLLRSPEGSSQSVRGNNASASGDHGRHF
jgi:hypothetical protein